MEPNMFVSLIFLDFHKWDQTREISAYNPFYVNWEEGKLLTISMEQSPFIWCQVDS
jgi:hypothetical protein